MQKRLIVVTLITFTLFIFLIGVISAASCSIKTSCGTGEHRVMGLTALTNAHGQLASQTGYPYSLCCDFGAGDTTCTGTNKIIGLSAPTNAHAEVPSETTYTNHVCYEGLSSCIDRTIGCTSDEIEVINLSATTNAHLGNGYRIAICCTPSYGPASCSLTNAFWSKDGTDPITQDNNEIMEGNEIKLVVEGTNCEGVSVLFEVFEDDEGPATNQPEMATFSDNKVVGTWTAEWTDDGLLQGDPEYYFNAKVYGNEEEMVESNDPLLTVYTQESVGFDCGEINLCSDYKNQEDCESDTCDVALSDPNCNPETNCACFWDSETNTCKLTSSSGPLCGNGIIDAGEQCDGINWGKITGCSDFNDFTGGDLLCIDCKFNTVNCTGGNDFGPCGDNIVNRGETCDGTNFGPITGCSDFNEFTNGILACDDTCQFNTSLCTGGSGWDTTKTLGTCIYTTSTDDDCSDGYLSYSWTATWEGTGEKPDWCEDGSRVMECPAQAKLPFFNKYSLIATIILIAVVYCVMIILKKKKLMKRKGRRRKGSKRKGRR